ncbi:protease [Mucilaginibacter terrenus]|uniref:Protease n=1 Tax=Mucilaginibacter terrenus TaxID=2482727 RepID=A0A3E2NXG5_9SPHI|nr:protease [Mucilaginibacter terrenus]RFZ85716.1 protease [Mucilaginibacter terrenus]
MKIRIFLAAITICLFSFGCKSRKQLSQEGASNASQNSAGKLIVHMTMKEKFVSSGSALLSFTVINNTNRDLRFCKWETPFEPRIGKYFEIIDGNGNEAVFKGAMARRVMPPPASAYITVAAKSKVTTEINLATNYVLAKTKYKLTYVGSGVSGLQVKNTISFSVAN